MFHAPVFLLILLILPRPSQTNPDNLALLTGTLKTMQRAACDDETVSLACPRGTSISIQVAQYGKAAPEGHSCIMEGSNSQPVAVEVVGEEKCLWPNSMQYSLLQTVVEACQKKPQCKFSTKSKPGLVDPCPFARKFVEVAYKCRPYEFRSRTGCENEIIKLSCNPHSRIAIFDAQYGRTTYESITCPQTQGVLDETCTAPFAAEAVMQICHGKRHCEVLANHKTFGSACKPGSRNYLKIVYACVLTEKYESAAEKDEIISFRSGSDQEETVFNEAADTGEKWSESNIVPPLTDPASVSSAQDIFRTENAPLDHTIKIAEEKNKENKTSDYTLYKIQMYTVASILIFSVLILFLVGVRCFIKRRQQNNSKIGDMFSTEAPNVFEDGHSDIDNDVDVSHISGTFYDPVHPDMILYKDLPGKGTLRAMRPLSTVYPCAGASMYGNVDFVPSQSRDMATNRFDSYKKK
ncbi:unnamed protein product [Parnassius apollo]|uniref:(apollo) hypothetical protein n=1 Tax=Parnassius apollo TaxID=110799 RepID=A0A8S3XQG7_PARAO|nr:unnamed protein product [Parnassius apollo]